MIKIYLNIIIHFFKMMACAHKYKDFYKKEEGPSAKFKLFGRQYNKEYKYEKMGRKSPSKTIQYIQSISNSFDKNIENEERIKNMFESTVLLTLWYIYMKSEYTNENKQS